MVEMEITNGHVLMLSFGMMCLMVGAGAFLMMRAIKDYRELFCKKTDIMDYKFSDADKVP